MDRPEDLMINGYVIWQERTGFRSGNEAVRLYEAIPPQRDKRIVELCAGSGAVALMLLASGKARRITTVEIRENAVALCRKSARENDCEGRMDIRCGDLRKISDILFKESFDTVVVNPPFYPVGSGILPKDPDAAASKYELYCTLDDVLAAAAHLLCEGGTLYMIHDVRRRKEILQKFQKYNFIPTDHKHCGADPAALFTARKISKEGSL